MTTFFAQSGSTFSIQNDLNSVIHDKLPAGNYAVKQNPMTGAFYLESTENFEAPGKIYGDPIRYANRILNTFQDKNKSLGTLLAGEKGSGKSMLCREICRLGYALEYPTLIITSPMRGDGFFQFLHAISQPTIVFFDEFEKVYDRDEQQGLLTLLDGVFPSKKLWLLTCNDKWRLDSHMRNRPGRIHYMIEFQGLDMAFIKEYCEDRLDDKTQIDGVLSALSIFHTVNFDTLQALVSEMNLYKESALDSLELLNARPDSDDKNAYSVSLVHQATGITWGDAPGQGEGKSFSMDGSRIDKSPLHLQNHFVQFYNVDLDDLAKAGKTFEQVKELAASCGLLTEQLLESEGLFYKLQSGVKLTDEEEDLKYLKAFRNKSISLSSKDLLGADLEAGVFEFKADPGFVIKVKRNVSPGLSIREAMGLLV